PALVVLLDGEPWCSTLTRTSTATMASTSTMLPPANKTRLRRSARCCAARWAATRSRALCCLPARAVWCLVLLVLLNGSVVWPVPADAVAGGGREHGEPEQQERDDVHVGAVQADVTAQREQFGVEQ